MASDKVSELVKIVSSPRIPIWRIARRPDPLLLRISDPKIQGGNRYDSPISGQYSVLYFGSTVEVCYGELLARFSPVERKDQSALLLDKWEDSSWMNVGSIPTIWRDDRAVVSIKLKDELRFFDMNEPENWQVIYNCLSSKIPELKYNSLEEQIIFGSARKITRLISGWIYDQKNEKGERLYAGIYFPSRLNSKYSVNWNCWAVFADDKPWQKLSQRPVSKTDSALNKVARLYGLTVH